MYILYATVNSTYVCTAYTYVCLLIQEPDIPDAVPTASEGSERSFQLGPVTEPTSCPVLCKEKNKTMDELFDWQHIPSPLDEEEIDVSFHFACMFKHISSSIALSVKDCLQDVW